MLYVADLRRDGLLKVGITHERRARARVGELRRDLTEPHLEVFLIATVPYGWGTDRSWERRLFKKLMKRSNRLQLFAKQHKSTEVVEATRDEARAELQSMLRRTEVDPQLAAPQLDPEREDWRFEGFLFDQHLDYEASHHYWQDVVLRQVFLYWLRGEPTMRALRLSQGYSCAEIDELAEGQYRRRQNQA
jgi:hypothetical protein